MRAGILFAGMTGSESSLRWRRVLIKLSGEAFAGEQGVGLNPDAIDYLAREVIAVHQLGVQTAVVVGGGNIVRGASIAPDRHRTRHRRLHGHAGDGD
jgi:uridylate kinase